MFIPKLVVAITGIFLFCLPCFAASDQNKARLGHTMWSAFVCGTYAEMSGDEKEQTRLFELGVKAGRDFLGARESHQITDDDLRNEVPFFMLLVLQGPSTDFIIGRVFQFAYTRTFDEIAKHDAMGLPIEKMSDWVTDKETQKTIAHSKFLRTNCASIK
jgi:hypothetical protein